MVAIGNILYVSIDFMLFWLPLVIFHVFPLISCYFGFIGNLLYDFMLFWFQLVIFYMLYSAVFQVQIVSVAVAVLSEGR